MRAWTALGLAALAALPPSGAAGQTGVAANPSLAANANGVRDPAHARALRLRRFAVAAVQRGAVAEVTVDAAFANPTGEVLEGDFRLRLPAGAVVTGYALDIGGKPVDGVLIDRPRAKAVYEARVRRGVDPGVAATTPDGVFETRVHPILPGRGRTVRVTFTAPVPLDGLRLPLAIDAPSEGWTIGVHVGGATAAPVGDAAPGGALTFRGSADGYDAGLTGARALAGDLVLRRAATPDLLAATHRTGERDLELGGALPERAAATGGSVRVYWDRSRARLDGRPDAEIALLRRWLAEARPATIELAAFNSSGATRHAAASADDAAAWLKALRYRGATSFAPLAHEGPADRCLLFSDGRPTIDRDAGFAPACRLDAVGSGPAADLAWLRHLAGGHGGRAVALGDDPAAALALLRSAGAGVLGVTDQDGRALPFVPLDAAPGRWLVLARAPAGGPVRVRFAGGEVTRDAGAEAAPFDGDGALLGQDALATLGATDQRADFVATSRRYGIASPSLSFLVLEGPADYLAAKVDPPATLPADQRDAYARAYKAAVTAESDRQSAWTRDLAERWREQVAWWRTKFDPNARPKRVATSEQFDRTEAPPPPPPPAPVPPPPMVAAPSPPVEAQDLVVTGTRVEPGTRGFHLAGRGSAEAKVDGAAAAATPAIQIDAWQPDRPYLELYDGKPADFDERFLEAEKRHGGLPIFYLDTAEWLRKHGRAADAAEMALSALELPTADEVTLGIVADRLERYGAIDRAVELRARAAALDPDRPQPRRLLALALARRAALEPAHARADLARAIILLYAIATTPQDAEWDGIELIALDEANALLPRFKRVGGDASIMDARFVQLLDVDVRVAIDWTTDGSDMDLWVDEPNKERAIYNNQRTAIGGRLSHDMTRGYGPEEYMLHTAPAGTYTVHANVFAPDRLDPNGATILTAHLFRDYGRPTQREESVDVELKRDESGAKLIGRMEVNK